MKSMERCEGMQQSVRRMSDLLQMVDRQVYVYRPSEITHWF